MKRLWDIDFSDDEFDVLTGAINRYWPGGPGAIAENMHWYSPGAASQSLLIALERPAFSDEDKATARTVLAKLPAYAMEPEQLAAHAMLRAAGWQVAGSGFAWKLPRDGLILLLTNEGSHIVSPDDPCELDVYEAPFDEYWEGDIDDGNTVPSDDPREILEFPNLAAALAAKEPV